MRFSRTSTTQAVATTAAEKIRKHIGESYSIDGAEIHITASIGLALYPADGQQYDALLNRADAAMYVDKARRMSPIVSVFDTARRRRFRRPDAGPS